jgi:hypothetical protein
MIDGGGDKKTSLAKKINALKMFQFPPPSPGLLCVVGIGLLTKDNIALM